MAFIEAAFILPHDPSAVRGDLEAYLPLLPGRIADRGTDFVLIRSGYRFALNPNRLRHTLRAEFHLHPEGTRLRVAISASPYPWLESRARRILEHRLSQLATFLSERIGSPVVPAEGVHPETIRKIRPETEPFLQGDWSGARAVAGSSFFLLLSVGLAMLFAFGVMELFGMGAIDRVVERLMARALVFEKIGEPAPPSSASLAGLSVGFRAACALFFALPFGYFIGFVVSLALLFQENRAGPAALVGWVLLALSAFLLLCLSEGVPFFAALGYALAAPLLAHAGYSLGCARRPLVAAGDAPSRSFWPLLCLGATASLILLGAMMFYPGKDARDDMPLVEFRDRHLMNNAWGRAFTDFYYEHTLFPAEAIREPQGLLPAVALVLSQRPEFSAFILGEGRNPLGATPELPPMVVRVTTTQQEFDQLAEGQPLPWDLFVIDTFAFFQGQTIVDYKFLESKIKEATAKLRTVAPCGGAGVILGEGDSYRVLGPASMTSPASYDKWEIAAGLALEVQDVRSHLRFLKGLSQSALFGTGGAFLLMMTAWILFAGGVWCFGRLPRRVVIAGLAVIGTALLFLDVVPGRWLPDFMTKIAHGDPAMIEASLKNVSSDVRFEAVYAVYRAKELSAPGRWIQALLPSLQDADPRVRAWTAGTLGKLAAECGPQDPARGHALQALLDQAKDSHYMVRYRTAEALGRIGDPKAQATLERMARNDVWYVGAYAYRALKSLK